MLHDLNAILDYVAELNELDTTGVAPLAQVSELEDAGGAAFCGLTRLQPRCDRAAVMAAGAGDRSGLLQSAEGD